MPETGEITSVGTVSLSSSTFIGLCGWAETWGTIPSGLRLKPETSGLLDLIWEVQCLSLNSEFNFPPKVKGGATLILRMYCVSKTCKIVNIPSLPRGTSSSAYVAICHGTLQAVQVAGTQRNSSRTTAHKSMVATHAAWLQDLQELVDECEELVDERKWNLALGAWAKMALKNTQLQQSLLTHMLGRRILPGFRAGWGTSFWGVLSCFVCLSKDFVFTRSWEPRIEHI